MVQNQVMLNAYPLMIVTLATIALCIIMCAGMWQMFKKMDIPGWKAIIPFYNFYVLFKRVDKTTLFVPWIVIEIAMSIVSEAKMQHWGIISCALAIALIFVMWPAAKRLSERFGKGSGFALLTSIIPGLGFIILGFGNAVYNEVPWSIVKRR